VDGITFHARYYQHANRHHKSCGVQITAYSKFKSPEILKPWRWKQEALAKLR